MTSSVPLDLLTWSPWQPLLECWKGDRVPRQPGLYRIRRIGHSDIDYIGQTGIGTMHLRSRLAMLKGIYGDVMPYNDPHTAGPALWAMRQKTGEAYEVSVVPVEGSTPWRKGMESLTIGLYRQEQKRSPTFNFGRMPSGYRKSSGNSAWIVEAGSDSEADRRTRPTRSTFLALRRSGVWEVIRMRKRGVDIDGRNGCQSPLLLRHLDLLMWGSIGFEASLSRDCSILARGK